MFETYIILLSIFMIFVFLKFMLGGLKDIWNPSSEEIEASNKMVWKWLKPKYGDMETLEYDKKTRYYKMRVFNDRLGESYILEGYEKEVNRQINEYLKKWEIAEKTLDKQLKSNS